MLILNINKYFKNTKVIFIFEKNICRLMAVDKQSRNVIHLEIGDDHHYFGSIRALCDVFGKDKIGITYKSLTNVRISADKPYQNKYCTIRKGVLKTALRAHNKSV